MTKLTKRAADVEQAFHAFTWIQSKAMAESGTNSGGRPVLIYVSRCCTSHLNGHYLRSFTLRSRTQN